MPATKVQSPISARSSPRPTPSAPTNLAVTQRYEDGVDIGWLASGDDGLEGAAVDYRCELIKEQALSEPPSVCDETAIPRFCGDGVCLGDETLASCPADCGGERLEVYEGCQAALTFSVDGLRLPMIRST